MATRNIVPRATGEGQIGTSAKTWGAGYFDDISVTNALVGDVTGTASGNLPLSGGTMTGSVTSNMTAPIIANTGTSGRVTIGGGTAYNTGAYVWLYGKDHSSEPGYFDFDARDDAQYKRLTGKPDGTLTWDSLNLIVGKYLGNTGSGTATNFTLPSNSGTYLVITSHSSSSGSNSLWIVRPAGNSAYKMAGGANITMTCSGATITVTPSSGIVTVSCIRIPTNASNT